MSRLSWSNPEERRVSSGVDRGVFYPKNGDPGVSWNGLINVSVEEQDIEVSRVYVDGFPRAHEIEVGDFAGSLEAYSYPEEFAEYAGGQKKLARGFNAHMQTRSLFDLCFRTKDATSLTGDFSDYTIHLVYNAIAIPSAVSYGTIQEEPEPIAYSWDLEALPITFEDGVPSSYFTVSTRNTHPYLIRQIENVLYGVEAGEDPKMISLEVARQVLEQSPPEILRNLARDPSFEGQLGGVNGWQTFPGSTSLEYSYEWAGEGYVSAKVSRTNTDTTYVGLQTNIPSAQTNRFIGVQVVARVNEGVGISQPRVSVSRGSRQETTLVPKSDGAHVVRVILDAASESGDAAITLMLNHTTPIGVIGEYIYFDNVVIMTADTETALTQKFKLLDQLGGFFDGDKDFKKWGYGQWTGVRDKSVSIFRSFGLPEGGQPIGGFGIDPFGISPFGGS